MTSSAFRTRAYIAIVVIAIAGFALFWFHPKWHTTSGSVWTTEYHITYPSRTDLADSISDVLRGIDTVASVYNEHSLLAAFNAGTDSVDNPLLALLLATSQQVHQASGGAFDPTVMPLVNAWGFGYTHGELPTDSQLDSLRAIVGLDKITLTGNTLTKTDPRVQLDFSSIAKGLACDEVGHMLERNGVKSYLVEIGGEVASLGVNNRGLPWHVSVDLPIDQADTTIHQSALVIALPTTPIGVATSGNYRKYIESGGERRSHIIDPRTGRSAQSSLLSVTVVAPSCMLADAWATAFMVLGTEATKQMTDGNDTLGVLTISADSVGSPLTVWSNAAFARLVVAR